MHTGAVGRRPGVVGPPGLDLGHMRWNLVLDHGQRVADLFLSSHRSIATTAVEDDQPYWDLVSLFDLLLEGVGPGHVGSEDLARLERYAYAVLDAYP